MKKFFRFLRNTILIFSALYVTSIFVDIRIEGVELKSIYENAYRETLKAFETFLDYVKSEPEVIEFVATKDDDLYLIEVTIKNVDIEDMVSIKMNDILYEVFDIEKSGRNIKILIHTEIEFDPGYATKTFEITEINYKKNSNVVTVAISYFGSAFKSLDNAIVELKKQSVVAIEACETGLFGGNRCTLQGSGVIYDLDTTTVAGITTYEYYIITNAHVAEGGSKYKIHYNSEVLPGEATLVGTYTIGADLAILSYKSTTVHSLVVLDDEQFTTFEAVPIYMGQTVFSVGSPSLFSNYQANFNKVLEGEITAINVPVVLRDGGNLCPGPTGCLAFQVTPALGVGSSGGAMFDTAGNLIGIHFAGNEENTTSSEIPMSIVFDAIKYIFDLD